MTRPRASGEHGPASGRMRVGAAAAALALAAACGSRGSGGDDLARLSAELQQATARRNEESATAAAARAGPGYDLSCLLSATPGATAPGALGGAAFGPGGLLVADAAAVYSVGGGRASPVATVERDPPPNRMPLVLAASPGGIVYAASPDSGRLFRIDPHAGRVAEVAAHLARPTALVATADGSVVVLESAAGRVTRVDPSGALLPVASGLSMPVGLAAHAGRFLVAEASGGRVLALRAGSPPVMVASGLGQPAGLAVDERGRIVVADAKTGAVLRVESDASRSELATGLATSRLVDGRSVPVPLLAEDGDALVVVAPGDGSAWRIAPR